MSTPNIFDEEDLKNLLPGDSLENSEDSFSVPIAPKPEPEKEPEPAPPAPTMPTMISDLTSSQPPPAEPPPYEEEKLPENDAVIANAIAPTWKIYIKFLMLFTIIFVGTFILINFSSLWKNINYFWSVRLLHKDYKTSVVIPSPQNTFNAASEAKLVIPKIGVEAPIVWNIAENDVNQKLTDGVVHSEGTALPGQKGNVFITGHSSYYSWSSSPYKDIFALLEELDAGDKLYIQYLGATFTYEVQSSKVVSPTDVSVMEATKNNTLTLMTCVPIGTNLNRLVVTSTQIST